MQPSVFYTLLQCDAVQCSAVQCNAGQCSAVQCSAVQCGVPVMYWSAIHYDTIHTLHTNVHYNTTLHNIELYCPPGIATLKNVCFSLNPKVQNTLMCPANNRKQLILEPTRRYSPLRGLSSSSCRELWPLAEVFFALWAKKKIFMLS